ncbi:DUF2332 domain-containing protein [Pleomorphomonas carboxyditropha]|uniref:DUF2332 domain-containing protein n=1 Tax=Pleomorphomonas carboxyditropha TaxID=2023338 RepID=A0A2G9WX56_9HYPH|nr:DUF2332 family protein [Pleomorphomonas carboxyditropha]PIO99288.1 hypothetical protein CJ014_10545 [Pleomorphomonas carboxyditropha]
MSDIFDHFRRQAEACRAMGSPFTARLADLAPRFVDRTTLTGRRVIAWNGHAGEDAVPLRLFGGLHRLVLTGRDAGLAAVYPPAEASDEAIAAAVGAAVAQHDHELHDILMSPPQTNEVGRSAMLLPGFLWLARRFGPKLDILEIGASAGLNLHWDDYAYRYGDTRWGNPKAPIELSPDCDAPPPLDGAVEVVHRGACDLSPLDPTNPEHRTRLLSYVWADQAERKARLVAALDHAAARPERVEAADAAEFLARELAAPPTDGALRVVVHSIFWQYLADPARLGIQTAMLRAAEAAPLAWLRLEADGRTPGAGLLVTLFPSGEHHVLARGDFHGRWLRWLGE